MAIAVEKRKQKGGKKVILAEPRGFCAGVERAIEIVERALEIHGAPVYVRKEIVHNQHVVRELEERGTIFVDSETEVPEGAVCIFSAHGVSPQVRENAAGRQLNVIDATCPLVSKVHQEARRYARDERTLLLIGHADHEEIEGTYGEAPDRTLIVEDVEEARQVELPPGTEAAFLTQTTLSLDDTSEIVDILKERFPGIVGAGSEDICYASQNRQNAIKAIAARSDFVLVVGATNSSNSIRMVEVAEAHGTPARLVPSVDHFDPAWLEGAETVGVSSGASAPEVLVQQLMERLATLGYVDVESEVTAKETVVFRPPSGLELPGEQAADDESTETAGSSPAGGGAAEDDAGKLLARTVERIEVLLRDEADRWGSVDTRAAQPVEAIAELVAAGGKRLRPTFCISGYLAAGGRLDGSAAEGAVVNAAAGVELLHTFALLHDDVLGNAPTRRGKPTAHVKHAGIHERHGWAGESRRYGDSFAIVAGDLAFSYANKITRHLPGAARDVWAYLSTEVIVGRQLDMALAAEPAPDPDLARWVAVCKSGQYTIHRPMALGAAIAGREDLREAYEAYGVAVGEAFQLRDDLLDAFGDSEATGKPAGPDVSEHKMNLLLALAAGKDADVAALVTDGENGDPDRLRAAMLASGVRQEAEDRIDELVQTARKALEGAPLADGWRERLDKMAQQVAYRGR
ncbi:4-hydroxy-3-methylbut-2-enyl diphosphate reductase [Streptomyces sp. WAC 06738]|uniref:4-hydroxy-3-methylbut-2-enyl diphosphate reductase n=1 Tax=Streptomyces sp. WAC 06738 TaxID=2203210 RepID=UPI000F701B97|nr:4-hydroxy-3-methylbut-2-enyl diphosphate reductase [Streptomyces sp. WAC 06738]AZM48662.1 4-hydroxy-3-methylbut-2-enyl diphosphate reductase [Streptomyces sp. WAC 06738]